MSEALGIHANTSYNSVMSYRDPGELRTKLASTVDGAWELNQALEAIVTHQPREVRPEITSRPVEAPLAWNSRAAYLVMELHADVRRRELESLQTVTTEWATRTRGGSEGNTRLAMLHLVKLAEAEPDDAVLKTLRWLDHWCTRARLVLGLVDPVVPLSQPDAAQVRCPWCDYLTLRVRTATATAYCVNPGCHYSPSDPRRPQGRVETDPVTRVISIYWQGKLPESESEAA